jgi:oligopeptide/dipeptide ABC transporter ATP-binding protein
VQAFPARGGLLRRGRGAVRAVDDVSLQLRRGETLGLVGESGSGKTTLARTIVRLLEPTAGTIRFDGRDITQASRRELRPLRRRMQIVFQDPLASLNPRRRVSGILAAPLRLHGVPRAEIPGRVAALAARVGLGPEYLDRYPHELSGGQRQRVGIARALALEPSLVVLDEPVSALDVSIQAQIVNLLADLQEELGLAYLFVAHDLAVVRHVSDRIAVMYLGRIVEQATAEDLYAKPIHPYTAALLAAAPTPDPHARRGRHRIVLRDEPPSGAAIPSGCAFHPRCPRARDRCRVEVPRLSAYPDGHLAACHYPLNVTAAEVAAAERSPLSPRAAGDSPPEHVEAPAPPGAALGR